MSIAVAAIGILLPYSLLASSLRFAPLPWLYWPLLAVTLLSYAVLTQGVKMWLIRKRWI
jgi:Mg2+-importing ATPase